MGLAAVPPTSDSRLRMCSPASDNALVTLATMPGWSAPNTLMRTSGSRCSCKCPSISSRCRCRSNGAITGASNRRRSSASPACCTMSMMVKLPPRRIIEASPRLQPQRYSAAVTCETMPGRSLPTTVSMNQFFMCSPYRCDRRALSMVRYATASRSRPARYSHAAPGVRRRAHAGMTETRVGTLSMQRAVHQVNGEHPGRDQAHLLHGGGEIHALVQAGKEIGHRHVDAARRGDGERIRHYVIEILESVIGDHTAGHGGEPG